MVYSFVNVFSSYKITSLVTNYSNWTTLLLISCYIPKFALLLYVNKSNVNTENISLIMS